MAEKQKILLDMDIGDDIDDAIALYAAMRQGFEIVGVTTVFQNTRDRARQVKKLLREYGHGYEKVPVYAGCGTPLQAKPEAYPHIPHYTPDLEQDLYAPDGESEEDAIAFIIDACRRYGKELTVIALGAFTNLARVIERDADALRAVAQVAIMGGAYFRQYVDWNVLCDVEAADVLFRSLDGLVCIGADVTHRTAASEEIYNNLLNYDGSEAGHVYLTELCGLWRQHCPNAELVLHDPLVVYCVADPSLCGMQRAPVQVITEGYARGLTLNVDAYGKKHYNPCYADFDGTRQALVAKTVDVDAFFAHLLRDICV